MRSTLPSFSVAVYDLSAPRNSSVQTMSLDSPYFTDRSHAVELDPTDLANSWNNVVAATNQMLTPWGVQQLRSGLDNDARTVLVEDQYVCKDYRNLHSHFYTKKFLDRPSNCSRLHFFSESKLTKEDIVFRSDELADAYMGYSVIEPLASRCVGRTIIDPTKLSSVYSDDFFCLRTKFPARIQGAEYQVNGFPYRSQSAEATVCAHTVLWSVCRYLSQRYHSYQELLPYDLIERTGASYGRRVPNRAMTYNDYSEILDSFGCYPLLICPRNIVAEKKDRWHHDRDAFYDLYAYMESGFPILTSLGGHVVSLVGHTLQATPRADHPQEPTLPGLPLINSAAYVDSYVVVDDNFFPYQRLCYEGESQYHQNCYAPTCHPSIDNIYAAVVPLPEKVFLAASDAREKAYRLLSQPGIQQIIEQTRQAIGDQNGPVVSRQLVTTGTAFKAKKRAAFVEDLSDRFTKFPMTVNLPHFIWVIELLTHDLAGKRRAFAEIIVDATQGKADWDPIYVRIGQNLLARGKRQNDTGVSLTFRQFIHNLGGST